MFGRMHVAFCTLAVLTAWTPGGAWAETVIFDNGVQKTIGSNLGVGEISHSSTQAADNFFFDVGTVKITGIRVYGANRYQGYSAGGFGSGQNTVGQEYAVAGLTNHFTIDILDRGTTFGQPGETVIGGPQEVSPVSTTYLGTATFGHTLSGTYDIVRHDFDVDIEVTTESLDHQYHLSVTNDPKYQASPSDAVEDKDWVWLRGVLTKESYDGRDIDGDHDGDGDTTNGGVYSADPNDEYDRTGEGAYRYDPVGFPPFLPAGWNPTSDLAFELLGEAVVPAGWPTGVSLDAAGFAAGLQILSATHTLEEIAQAFLDAGGDPTVLVASGDANSDGVVDTADFDAFRDALGATFGLDATYDYFLDVNGDGVVSGADLEGLLAAWSAPAPPDEGNLQLIYSPDGSLEVGGTAFIDAVFFDPVSFVPELAYFPEGVDLTVSTPTIYAWSDPDAVALEPGTLIGGPGYLLNPDGSSLSHDELLDAFSVAAIYREGGTWKSFRIASASAPEPSAMTLLILGAFGSTIRRRQ